MLERLALSHFLGCTLTPKPYSNPKTLLQPQNYFGCHRVMEEGLDIAAIAPCYNEEVTIGGVIDGFKSVMKGITA